MAGFSSYVTMADAERSSGQMMHAEAFYTLQSTTAARWIGGANFFLAADAPTSTPGSAYTSKGLNFPNTTPKQKHLVAIQGTANVTGSSSGFDTQILLLYDRLVAVGPISTTTTGSKTINSAALPRYTNGLGVIPVYEQASSLNSSTTAITLESYTNSGSTAAQAGPSMVLSNIASQFTWPGLQLGDVGVKSVESINVTVASVTTGSVNVVLIKPIAWINVPQQVIAKKDFILRLAAPVRIYDGASLEIAGLMSTGLITAASCLFALKLVYG